MDKIAYFLCKLDDFLMWRKFYKFLVEFVEVTLISNMVPLQLQHSVYLTALLQQLPIAGLLHYL